MGTQGLCARMRVGTLAGGRRGRRVIAPFVVSIGLLPALVGCSSFSSTSSSPPNSVGSTSSSPPAAAGPVTARGGVTVGPPPSGPYSYDEFGPQRHPGRCFPPQFYAARTDGSDGGSTECPHVVFSTCLCRSLFRSRWCDGGPSSFGPSHRRHGAQRPPRQHFQIQFDAVRGAVKYAAPAKHLHRLGAALHAAARSGCPAGTSAGKFRAVMIVSAQNWVSSRSIKPRPTAPRIAPVSSAKLGWGTNGHVLAKTSMILDPYVNMKN